VETIDVASLRMVGGSLALDFLNTRVGPPTGGWDADALNDYDSLVVWARDRGELTTAEAAALQVLSSQDAASAHEVFVAALDAREYLDAVFRSLTRGQRPRRSDLDRLGADAAQALGHAALDGGANLAWSWRGDSSLRRPLHPIFHAAVELLSFGRLERVKACAGCNFLFIDGSKNGSRRWCSMSDCGTSAKMQRYVAARRSRAGTRG